jgi:MFS family permease
MLKKQSPFTALRRRDFRLLWLGLLISRIGSEMQVVGVNWHVYMLTKSPLSLGIIGLARFLPLIFFSLLAGVMADVFSRKKIIFSSQLLLMVIALILALTTVNKTISPLLIYILIAFSSTVSIFDSPARQSIVPLIVPKKDFMNAVSLNSIMWQLAVIVGPALAGIIIAVVGLTSIYLINAMSFLAVIFALIFMKPIPQSVKNKPCINWSSIKEGIIFVRKTPLIYSTMLIDFFATFLASATTLMPIFANEILSVGPKGMGLLYAAPSIGAVVAGLIFSSFKVKKHQGKILIMAVIFYGFTTILFGLSRSFYLSLLFIGLSGAFDVIATIIRNTIRHMMTPDYLRGRMVAVNMIFYQGGPQLGEFEAGLLAVAVGAPASVIVGGIGAIITTSFLAYLVPKLRNYQTHEALI